MSQYEQLCNIHDFWAAQCPRCLHRSYSFARDRATEFSPEALMGGGIEDKCEFCGSQTVTVPRMTQDCNCKRCVIERAIKMNAGIVVTYGRICNNVCKDR